MSNIWKYINKNMFFIYIWCILPTVLIISVVKKYQDLHFMVRFVFYSSGYFMFKCYHILCRIYVLCRCNGLYKPVGCEKCLHLYILSNLIHSVKKAPCIWIGFYFLIENVTRKKWSEVYRSINDQNAYFS